MQPCTVPTQHCVSTSDLVPLDVLILAPGAPAPCDCLLLRGEAVVNEAPLTGESAPCRKVSWTEAGVDPYAFCADRDRDCVLFAGTQVLQVLLRGCLSMWKGCCFMVQACG